MVAKKAAPAKKVVSPRRPYTLSAGDPSMVGGKRSKRADNGNVINKDNGAIMVFPANRAGAYGQASNYNKELIGPAENDYNNMLSHEGLAHMGNPTFYAKHAKRRADGMVLAPQDRSDDTSRQPGM